MTSSSEIVSDCGPCLLIEAQTALETLLCRENVTCDLSLAAIMNQDWSIPAEALTTHRSLSHLELSVEDLLQAAAASTTLAANFDAQTVTPELKAKRTTVIIRDLSEDVGEDELRHLLMQFPDGCVTGGQNGHISPASTTDSPTSNSVTDSPYGLKYSKAGLQILALRRDFGNSWFLTLTDEDVTTSVAMWLRSQRFRGGDLLKVRVKSSIDLNASVCPLGVRQHHLQGAPCPKKGAPDCNAVPGQGLPTVHVTMGEAPDGSNNLSYGDQMQSEGQDRYPVADQHNDTRIINADSSGVYAAVPSTSQYNQGYHAQQDHVDCSEQDPSHGAAHYVDVSGAPIVQDSSGCAQCDQQQVDVCSMNTAPCCDASGMYPCSGDYIAPADDAEYAYPSCGDSNCCVAGCTGWGGGYTNGNLVTDGSVMPVRDCQQGIAFSTCVPDECGNCYAGDGGVTQASVASPCCMDAHGVMVDNVPVANYNMDSQNGVGGKSGGGSFRGSRGRRRGGYGEWQGGRRQAPDTFKQHHNDTGVVERNNGSVYREFRRSDGNERSARQHDGTKTNSYDNRYYKSRNECSPDGNADNRNRGRPGNRKGRADCQPHRDQPTVTNKEHRMKKVTTPMTPQDFPSLTEAATLCKSSSFGKRSNGTSKSFESGNERSRESGAGSYGGGTTNKRAFSPEGEQRNNSRRGGRGPHQRSTWTLKDHMTPAATSSSTTADSAEESAGKGKAIEANGASKITHAARNKGKRGDKKGDKKDRAEGHDTNAAVNQIVVSVATGGFDSSSSGDLVRTTAGRALEAETPVESKGLLVTTAALDSTTNVAIASPFAENLVSTATAVA